MTEARRQQELIWLMDTACMIWRGMCGSGAMTCTEVIVQGHRQIQLGHRAVPIVFSVAGRGTTTTASTTSAALFASASSSRAAAATAL